MGILFYISKLGFLCIRFLSLLGCLVKFIFIAINSLFSGPFYLRNFLHQLFTIGFLSLPVIGLTAIFTGAALALQIFSGGARFNAENVVP